MEKELACLNRYRHLHTEIFPQLEPTGLDASLESASGQVKPCLGDITLEA